MKIIKVTYPKEWDNGLQFKSGFHRQTPNQSAIWDDYIFYINDSISECDYWLIYGFIPDTETVTVKNSTVLFLSEEEGLKRWNDNFMQQFNVVLGSQENINHPNYIHDCYPCAWYVTKSYDDLVSISPPAKSKKLSMVVSNTVTTKGHKKRYDFVKRIKDHFGEQVDWFGKGNNYIYDKWDGIIDYKYSIAIENQRVKDYFTEKIADCFLSYTIPFYYGCKNIEKYFPSGSYVLIDIENINKSIDIIEQTLQSDFYEKNFDAMMEARELILKKYQFVPHFCKVFDQIEQTTKTNSKITLMPESHFLKPQLIETLKKNFRKILNITHL